MNTNRVNAAAGVLHAAMQQGKTLPQSMAYALESAQLLQSPETVAEQLAALQTRVAELDKDCDEVLGERDYLSDLADRFASAVAPVEVIGEHSSANDPWTNALGLVTSAAEVDALRARVVELEAERHTTNEALSDAAEQLRRDRDRFAELEAELRTVVAARDAQIIAWLGKKSREYGSSNREARDKAEAVGRMADKLRRGAVRRPHEDGYVSPLYQDHTISHDLPEVSGG